MLNIVIPHKNRHSVLLRQLEQLNLQSFEEFDVTVVDDGSDLPLSGVPNTKYNLRVIQNNKHGPAAARNKGVSESSGHIILFLGSDCIPDRNLVYRHYANYIDSGTQSVQGFTPFHPGVMDTAFMNYLDKTGLQAAWQNLRKDNGWRKEANGFCLTTNFSIKRSLFESVGGFCERFPAPAWEDVELGYRLNQAGHSTVFDPSAINFHWHKYNLDTFAQRCYMEGKNRLHICIEQPQMAVHLLPPDGLRALRRNDPKEFLETARQYLYLNNPPREIQDITKRAIVDGCQLFSMQGALESIRDYSPVLWALEHVHKAEVQIQIMSAMKAVEQGNLSYAAHCYEWALQEQPDNWALHAFKGEILLLTGDTKSAERAFEDALVLAPGAEWPRDRL